jgi:hypothetical protein
VIVAGRYGGRVSRRDQLSTYGPSAPVNRKHLLAQRGFVGCDRACACGHRRICLIAQLRRIALAGSGDAIELRLILRFMIKESSLQSTS